MGKLASGQRIVGQESYGGTGFYAGRITSDGELATTSTERERDIAGRYLNASVSATTYAILVDLSDTTNFKHSGTARIDISQFHLRVDKPTATLGAIRIGVITAIDGTSASISYGMAMAFENNGETVVTKNVHFTPSQLKFGVSGGALTRLITNDSETGVTAVNTGVTLASPRGAGTVTPAVGDVIAKLSFTSGSSYRASIEYFYHGETTA